MRKTTYLLLFICTLAHLLISSFAFSQQAKVDSLEKLLENIKQDTTRLRLYLALGDACDIKDNLKYAQPAVQLADKLLSQTTNDIERKKLLKQKANAFDYCFAFYQNKNDTSKAFEYERKKLSIYQDIKDTANIVESILRFGNDYYGMGNFPKAIEYYQKGMAISLKMNYKRGIGDCLIQMGARYNEQGDIAQAMENYQKSLSIGYELKDTSAEAGCLIITGNLYGKLHNVKNALECFHKAISLFEAIKNKNRVRETYNSIGNMYRDNNDFPNALVNYQKSLSMSEEMKDDLYFEPWVHDILGNIGDIYLEQGDIMKALDYHYNALKIAEEHKDEYNITKSYKLLARTYLKQQNYKKAKDYSDRFLDRVKKHLDVSNIRNAEQLAAKVDSASGNYKDAYAHYQQYILLRDKLKSEEVRRAATKERFQSDYDKQKAVAKAEQDKKDIIVADESRRERVIRYSIIGGLVLMFIIAIIIFRSLRVTRKQKNIIEVQKTEVEKKNHIIEEKNKDITDSINYAKRIQSSFLAPLNEIAAALPNSFVLFKPKDIVSGDFYWFEKKEDKIFIAACDCTGHGVPGAIMSMLGADKLNEALAQSTDVSLMLSHVNKGVKKALRQSGNDDSTRDGMDIALLSFQETSHNSQEMQYAGANRPLWIIRHAESVSTSTEIPKQVWNDSNLLTEIKATKSAIGGLTSDDQQFAKHTIQLNKGDTVYIASDGFADQFSPNDKKLMTKKFKEILVSIQDKSMEEQKNFLNTFIENWKGNMEQTDDVLVIGVRV